jgi:excisionase family DNA binding protein
VVGVVNVAPVLYTVDDVARLLKVSRSTVYRYVKDGILEGVKLSPRARLRFQRSEILAALSTKASVAV